MSRRSTPERLDQARDAATGVVWSSTGVTEARPMPGSSVGGSGGPRRVRARRSLLGARLGVDRGGEAAASEALAEVPL